MKFENKITRKWNRLEYENEEADEITQQRETRALSCFLQCSCVSPFFQRFLHAEHANPTVHPHGLPVKSGMNAPSANVKLLD